MKRRRWIFALPVLLFLLTLSLGGIFLRDVVASSGNIYEELTLFNEVLHRISNFYVEEIDPDSLIDGAIVGMLEQLDPHSNYMDAERFGRMEERNRGSYSGIGISFAIRNGHLTVISPIEGGPSYDLGIRSGDIISHIEGESAYDIKEQEVFDQLRGTKGTRVNVTIRRAGESEPLEFEIIRDHIPILSVPYSFMLSDGVGYIRMSNFSARTGEELETALQELEDLGMEKLILDLRGNSGGYLNAAVEVADKFIGGGKQIVYTQGRIAGSSEEYYATDRASYPNLPLVVLIDQGSASASEIVSGAVQDWDRGIVAGRTSFGKGLVQRQYRLRNDGALLLTVARYYTPSGRLIQRPYEAGERMDYYRHAGDNGDSTHAEIDSTTAEADTTGRPVYHTLVRARPVYGGGGITPDENIDGYYRRSQLSNQLFFDRKYFDYAKQGLADSRIFWDKSFNEFLTSFEVSDSVLQGFQTFLEADSFAFEPDTFAVHADELKTGIRAEVARYLWGEEERYHILIQDDPALLRAIELIPDAEVMLTETRRLEALQQQGKAQR